MSLLELLKDGSKHYSGVEEAVLRNIEACKQLSQILRTSFGPNGMNKMVINHLEKLFVTNDAATIIKELDVLHPAAKMIVMASKQQENEVGDGTNLVVVLAGEFLHQAESLINMGLHVSDIIQGYSKAGDKALSILSDLVLGKVEDVRNEAELGKALRSVIASKQYGFEDIFTPIIAKACISVLPENIHEFSVDSVRVCKVPGGSTSDTSYLKGFAIVRDSQGTIKHVKDAKVVVLAGGLEPAKTETKGVVLLTSADELLDYSKGEERIIEQEIKELASSGANVLVVGGAVSDIALHFTEKYNLMVVKENSKFQLRRICKATGAIPMMRLGKPAPEQIGSCDEVSVEEIGSTKVTFFRNSSSRCTITTILIRGSTQNILDDVERCIDDAVNSFKVVIRDPRLLAGAGASEIQLAASLIPLGDNTPGLDQYAIKKYAEALEIIPRTLAENAGVDTTEIISSLYASHHAGNDKDGVNVEDGTISSAAALNIFDLFLTKYSAIKLATEVALEILRVDQIIMMKPSGGPKIPEMGGRDTD